MKAENKQIRLEERKAKKAAADHVALFYFATSQVIACKPSEVAANIKRFGTPDLIEGAL